MVCWYDTSSVYGGSDRFKFGLQFGVHIIVVVQHRRSSYAISISVDSPDTTCLVCWFSD
jgi:hypothetical protein